MHFIGLAGLLFLVAEIGGAIRGDVIEIDPLEVEWRIQQLERSRGEALAPDERSLAEQAYVDEQILAREAGRRGLDDDSRIRSILAQRMLHVLSAGVAQPSEAELRAYYEENTARYARPPSVTVEQVLALGEGGRGRRDVAEPAGGERAADGPGEAEPTLLREVTLDQLSMAFGPETAEGIFATDPGDSFGPHRTTNGSLWFRVVERFEASPPPPLEDVLGQVRFDWITEREEALLQERLAELRGRYSVRYLPAEREY